MGFFFYLNFHTPLQSQFTVEKNQYLALPVGSSSTVHSLSIMLKLVI